MNICVYGASSNTIDSSYIEQTEYLGRQMAKKLFVYAGSDHKHAAQKPEPLELA